MNTPTDLSFTWLLAADFLTAVSFVLALYIFFLSPSQRANRYVSLAVLIIAVSDLGIAMTLAARTYDQAVAPFALVAALSPIAGPMLTLATLVLVKPEATLGRWRWLRNGLLLLAIIPAALTLVDQLAGTNLYYPGIDAGSYLGGYIEFFGLLTGTFGRPVVIFYVFTFNIALIFLQAYFAFLDRKLNAITRRLALILFVVQLVGVVFNLVFNNVLP
ncbi:MAG: hypothetical protein JW726_18890, partial [Anaerolineales bacterium]|nr:hypothetical protein [Anaerolineales bacterium]